MPNSLTAPEFTSETVRLQVVRILESDLFREAPVQKRLLQYLVDESLAGNAENLKEYALGTAVFQRGERFDPRTDSIVRVQIGVLRKKLAAYYAGPGSRDTLLVEVPRGHYAPHFSPLTPLPEAAAGAPVESPQASPLPASGPGRQCWIYLAVGFAAGALLTFAILSSR